MDAEVLYVGKDRRLILVSKNNGGVICIENVKFAENRQQMGFCIVLTVGDIWIIAMRNVIHMAKMERGMIAKNAENVNTICTMFMESNNDFNTERMENIMLENIWRYSINEGEAGGIVIAYTKEQAEKKVKEMYEDYDGSENTEDKIAVWKAILDDDYSKDYPDMLEIY